MVRQPNLLFIFTDQQRADTIECYGNNRIQAPHINGLARESFVFQNAYVSAPLCTPSRSTILTGLYPHTHGAVANNMPLGLEHRTIAEMVSEHYTCAYYGKWHLGDEVVPQRGFQGWLSIEDYYRQYYTRSEYLSLFSDYHHYLVRNGYEPDAESEDARVFSRPFAAKVPEQHTKAAFLGREAARFIREVGDQPFILYVNFLEPHQPYDGPLNDMYRRDELEVGPHFLRRPSENTSRRHKIRADYYRERGTPRPRPEHGGRLEGAPGQLLWQRHAHGPGGRHDPQGPGRGGLGRQHHRGVHQRAWGHAGRPRYLAEERALRGGYQGASPTVRTLAGRRRTDGHGPRRPGGPCTYPSGPDGRASCRLTSRGRAVFPFCEATPH